jgi:D-alanyl-lipoteichoic acid acyltransferase DltB (MBOAT superfamily)
MLFNSPVFIFAFLPVALLGFFTLGRWSGAWARAWLAAVSLFFYGWWNPVYLLLIVGSTAVNFHAGRALQTYASPAPQSLWLSKRGLLIVGVAFNLVLLGYFKYFMFLVRNVNALTGSSFDVPHILLPLAISFFTFQKIAYLVDSYEGKAREDSFLNFLAFVSFFPQLIAGPIVHYSEVLPQLRDPRILRFDPENFTDGMTFFLLGLAKKVLLADELAVFADPVFAAAAQGAHPSFVAAWTAALAYALQLYFDFSGYSDMAIGLARMMNIRLPQNFNSPYQARNIIDFWRRWHMTLSRFLREYVYIPLGGNRKGKTRRYLNLMATMLIGGAWHGANWTFVVWGGVHGILLSANHLWNEAFGGSRSAAGRLAARALTLLSVVLAWVIFRAPTLESAGIVYAGMLGWHGLLLPDQVLALLPWLRHWFTGVGGVPYLAGAQVMGLFEAVVLLAAGFGIAILAPNLYRMSRAWRLALVALSFALTLQKVVFAGAVSPFLYFQF